MIRYILLVLIGIMLMWSCGSEATQESTTAARSEAISEAALEAVRDSMGMDDAIFEQVEEVMLKYEKQLKEAQKKTYNNDKTKQQILQNLMKSRRTELSDILKARELMTFNKLYKYFTIDERKRIRNETKLSEEDRKALTADIRQYRSQSVFPIIAKNRKALEAAMGPSDKAHVNTLREKITDFNTRLKNQQETCTKTDKTDKKALRDCRRELQKIKKQFDPIQKEVETFTASLKSSQATKPIMDDMEKQREIWLSDIKKMLDSYTEEPTPADKIPLGKYLRLVQPMPFLMLDPDNINEEALQSDD